MENYAAKGLADYPEQTWKKLKAAAMTLKNMEPYLLSTETAPEIRVENSGKAKVHARAWLRENGKLCVAVVGSGGGNAEAVLHIPGNRSLKSSYGRTVSLGNGCYRFTSADLGSDLLFD